MNERCRINERSGQIKGIEAIVLKAMANGQDVTPMLGKLVEAEES